MSVPATSAPRLPAHTLKLAARVCAPADVALLTNAFWPSDSELVAPAEDGGNEDDEGYGRYDGEKGHGLLDDDDD